jgi:D-alanyl-D-alanine carboxypeptidase
MDKRTRSKLIVRIIAIIIVAIIVVSACYYLVTTKQQVNALAEYIQANPATCSVVSYTFDDLGNPVPDGSEIYYNADTPLVLASTMKLIVLAAYESAVTRGVLDPNDWIPVSDLEKYYLPLTDGGAHLRGLASLGIKADALGFAIDRTATVKLDDIARIMIHYSGNSETDYLIDRIGQDQVNLVHGMAGQTPIELTLGPALVLMNPENADAGEQTIQEFARKLDQTEHSQMDQLIDLYLHDPSWREIQIEYIRSGKYLQTIQRLGWEGQVGASHLFPKGTARGYADMMARIASGQFISEEVSLRMQEKLESVPSDWPLRVFYFNRYGAKDGATAGVLTLASYAVLKWGGMAGKNRVVVILTNDLPYDQWLGGMQSMSLYLLQTKLARGSYDFSE